MRRRSIQRKTTSTVCICMPVFPLTDPLPDPVPVLALPSPAAPITTASAGSMDGETLDSTYRVMELVDSALKIVRDIDKMGVDKNEASGESPTEIAVAAETEPPSLTVRDVPRNVLKAGDFKQIECEIAPTEPSSLLPSNTKEAVIEHLKMVEMLGLPAQDRP